MSKIHLSSLIGSVIGHIYVLEVCILFGYIKSGATLAVRRDALNEFFCDGDKNLLSRRQTFCNTRKVETVTWCESKCILLVNVPSLYEEYQVPTPFMPHFVYL